MNLKETVEWTLNETKYYGNLTWEQDWGIIKEITDPNDLKEIEKYVTKRDTNYLPLQENHRVFKVSDNWRKRVGYMVMDDKGTELAFYDVVIY